MKKLIIGFIMILFLAACSSGEPKTIDEAVKDVVKENYKIEENANGKVSVTITHEGSKGTFIKKSAKIFANLHNLDVPAASIQWHAKLTDTQGNKTIEEVYGLNFEENEFNAVNWANYKKVDLEQSATAIRQHGALK
ncbi:hypothetical protein [Bacillus sp. Hm123]|uniref:hypothetical protein n=1 Tax=Bacillus sp. Hm123 TaxID=3450745 RepID=UPI003F41E010